MTGLLPHSHGVLTVTHCVDEDQSCLRDAPHWAQRLEAAGYRTGYFGKWHVERSGELDRFGWQTYAEGRGSALYRDYRARMAGADAPPARFSREMDLPLPPGYAGGRFYGVTSEPPERRPLGLTCGVAGEFLDNALAGQEPWCCFVSVTEPHDPFIAGEEAFARYDVDSLPLPPSASDDDLADKPGLYRKVARQVFGQMTDRQKREAAACYYASITEIDAQFGRLVQKVEQAGQGTTPWSWSPATTARRWERTGCTARTSARSRRCTSCSWPGRAWRRGRRRTRAWASTICARRCWGWRGWSRSASPIPAPFAPAARATPRASRVTSPPATPYNGTRYLLSQRIAWDGPWKFVHNGFDFDETVPPRGRPVRDAQPRRPAGAQRACEADDDVRLATHPRNERPDAAEHQLPADARRALRARDRRSGLKETDYDVAKKRLGDRDRGVRRPRGACRAGAGAR